MRQRVDFTPPRSCCYWKESPPLFGGDKKSLNQVVCGLHTTRSHLAGQTRRCVGCTPSRLHLKGWTRQRVGCMLPRLCLESQMRRCVGCTLPHWHLEGWTRQCVGSTPPRWPLEQHYRREGAQMPSSPPAVSLFLSFPLLLHLPTPVSIVLAPSVLVMWRSTAGIFVGWRGTGGWLLFTVTWHGTISCRWRWCGMWLSSLALCDVAETVRPHP